MITTAIKDDIIELRKLFKAAFAADERECERFFSMRFVPENTLVFRRGEEILSALYLWYGELVCMGKRYPSDYIYAAATKNDACRQGIMGKLLESAAKLSGERGRQFLLLSPASEKLYEYYGKRGFSTAFFYKELTLKRELLDLISDKHSTARSTTPIASALFDLRETLFFRADGFSWNADAINYAVSDLIDGGDLIALERNAKLCAYAFIDGGTVLECVASAVEFPALAAEILRISPAAEFKFMLPPDFPLSAESFSLRPAGMIRPLTQEAGQLQLHKAYLGLRME